MLHHVAKPGIMIIAFWIGELRWEIMCVVVARTKIFKENSSEGFIDIISLLMVLTGRDAQL